MQVTATELRKDVYHILDSVLKSGVPVEIKYHGKLLKISTEEPKNRLKNFKGIPNLIVNGTIEEIDEIDWLKEWKY